MQRPVCALLAIYALMAQAQGDADLMKTPGCAAARQQLEAVLAAGGPRDRLTAVRRQAALLCLGVTIPEDSTGQPQLKAELAAPPPSAPKTRVQPPAVAVDGLRLRPTPSLASPPPAAGPLAPTPTRGACVQQGGLLNCP